MTFDQRIDEYQARSRDRLDRFLSDWLHDTEAAMRGDTPDTDGDWRVAKLAAAFELEGCEDAARIARLAVEILDEQMPFPRAS